MLTNVMLVKNELKILIFQKIKQKSFSWGIAFNQWLAPLSCSLKTF